MFPENLKEYLFFETSEGELFNCKYYIIQQLMETTGISFAPEFEELLRTDPTIYRQPFLFSVIDVLQVGERVKHLDIISNAKGFVLYKMAEERQSSGHFKSAIALFSQAKEHYRNALKSNPQDISLLRNFAQINWKLFKVMMAEEKLKELGMSFSLFQNKMLSPEDVETYVLSHCSLSHPLVSTAHSYFIKAIHANKKSANSYYYFAKFLFESKRFDLAEDCYLECLKLFPDAPSALYEYGLLLSILGNKDQSLVFLKKAELLKLFKKL